MKIRMRGPEGAIFVPNVPASTIAVKVASGEWTPVDVPEVDAEAATTAELDEDDTDPADDSADDQGDAPDPEPAPVKRASRK